VFLTNAGLLDQRTLFYLKCSHLYDDDRNNCKAIITQVSDLFPFNISTGSYVTVRNFLTVNYELFKNVSVSFLYHAQQNSHYRHFGISQGREFKHSKEERSLVAFHRRTGNQKVTCFLTKYGA
jgi:hypothetical protein